MKTFLLSALLLSVSAVNSCQQKFARYDEVTCSSRCCQGRCQAASCAGNKLLGTAPGENECVVNNKKQNEGSQCPWKGKSYGVSCGFDVGCTLNKRNNCYGKTVCATGVCPVNALGVFCIESGRSNSFKVCTCDKCQVGEWSSWSTCVNGLSSRSRSIIQHGSQCPMNLTETRPCTPNIDCQVSEWSEWSACVNNTQIQTRIVVVPPSGTGTSCPPLNKSQSCGDKCNDKVVTKADFYVVSFNKKFFDRVTRNDNGVTSVQVETHPQHGLLNMSTNGNFTYTPDADFCGTDTFVYRALNGNCYVTQEVVLTTTCGCGTLFDVVECVLNVGQPYTQCVLSSGNIITVANLQGYRKVSLRLTAKTTYKK